MIRPAAAHRLRSCRQRLRSFPYDLDEDLPRSRAIELAEEDALPATEHQRSVDDRDCLRRGRQEAGPQVRVSIRMEVVVVEALGSDLEVVVPVVAALLGRKLG